MPSNLSGNKKFALIGHSVALSLSPRLFAAAYGGRYAYELLDGTAFEPLWARFLSEYEGVNITAPYKQDAFHRVDFPSPEARLTGAVNLAVKTPRGIAGYNSDVAGAAGALREAGEVPPRALVVGAGGAGRAAAVAAQQMGCSLRLWNRTAEKAEALAALTGGVAAASLEEALAWAGLVLYALPGTAEVPPPLEDLSGKVVLEAEYRFPRLREIPCRKYLPGRRWLLHQALSGYPLFTGRAPLVEEMEKVL